MPGETAQAILDRLASFANRRLAELSSDGKPCAIETIVEAEIPTLRAETGAAEHLARAVSEAQMEPVAVPFATEAGQFQRAGWPSVVCGPGNIEQAHKPDEYIELAQLEAWEGFLDRAVACQCGEHLTG